VREHIPAWAILFSHQMKGRFGRSKRFLTRQTRAALARQLGRGNVVKIQRSTQAKYTRKFSDAIIAKRYLDLQRLRDEVRKAELNSLPQSTKKPREPNLLAN
jgi:hypothetical protein